MTRLFLFSVFSSVGGKKFPVLVPGALFNSSFLISPHDQALDKFSIYLFPQPLVASCNFFLSSLGISSLYNVHLERSVASHYLYTCHDAVSEPVNPTDRYKKKKGARQGRSRSISVSSSVCYLLVHSFSLSTLTAAFFSSFFVFIPRHLDEIVGH